MPRKKVKKAKVKKIVKVKQQMVNLAESMEKAFRDIPNKLRMQLRKDLSTIKQQEIKLRASLQKMQKQQKVIKNKQVALTIKAKGKLTAAVKNQLKNVKKAYDLINQGISNITKQIDQTKNHGTELSQKEAKFAALSKQISLLDKEWGKKVVKATTPKAKSTKKSSKKARLTTPISSEQPTTQEPMTINSATDIVDLNS